MQSLADQTGAAEDVHSNYNRSPPASPLPKRTHLINTRRRRCATVSNVTQWRAEVDPIVHYGKGSHNRLQSSCERRELSDRPTSYSTTEDQFIRYCKETVEQVPI